jgi:hypothetical protein
MTHLGHLVPRGHARGLTHRLHQVTSGSAKSGKASAWEICMGKTWKKQWENRGNIGFSRIFQMEVSMRKLSINGGIFVAIFFWGFQFSNS